mmetsp:Transcript_2611/g.9981  ORF Transcript_2611/g.9981 Transcript_2611/m.9981 type:complete len:733 (-) Transcript_2611:118-2316(-)|eukprot:CAMPEP_0117443424 /NCGR_PEP_ID=MMETSP0759-20121206/4687_1 /TAXON_ID=63605 /ORGANISM="Percolomonas cosmopolitus, Strain WS" /LENGTH=732 /DNA_ID=CAMNT_0005235397 /DNA_START=607 /DNA_END=2805 /DNA_ORIENTATION=-
MSETGIHEHNSQSIGIADGPGRIDSASVKDNHDSSSSSRVHSTQTNPATQDTLGGGGKVFSNTESVNFPEGNSLPVDTFGCNTSSAIRSPENCNKTPHQDRRTTDTPKSRSKSAPQPVISQQRRFSSKSGSKPVKLFVGQVPHYCSEKHLLKLFSRFGRVVEITIIRDRKPSSHHQRAFSNSSPNSPSSSFQSMACAFVVFERMSQAKKAIQGVHNKCHLTQQVLLELMKDDAAVAESCSLTTDSSQNTSADTKHVSNADQDDSDSPSDTTHDNESENGIVPPCQNPKQNTSVKPLQVKIATNQYQLSKPHPNNKLFVGMLHESTDESTLSELFGKYGTVVEVVVLRNQGRKSKQCGFIRFEKREEAERAIAELNGRYKVYEDESMPNLVVRWAELRAKNDLSTNNGSHKTSTGSQHRTHRQHMKNSSHIYPQQNLYYSSQQQYTEYAYPTIQVPYGVIPQQAYYANTQQGWTQDYGLMYKAMYSPSLSYSPQSHTNNMYHTYPTHATSYDNSPYPPFEQNNEEKSNTDSSCTDPPGDHQEQGGETLHDVESTATDTPSSPQNEQCVHSPIASKQKMSNAKSSTLNPHAPPVAPAPQTYSPVYVPVYHHFTPNSVYPQANLYCTNFPHEYSDTDVYFLFCPFGPMLSYKVFRRDAKRSTHSESPAFAFIAYASPESANAAIRSLHGWKCGPGKQYLKVSYKKQKNSKEGQKKSHKELELTTEVEQGNSAERE